MQYRTRELKNPVDSSGLIDLTGDREVEGAYADAARMIRKLADSDRGRRMFIRHAFRYWMGRNEELSDSPALMAADKAYLENDGSFKALVISLLCSDSFLYRVAPDDDRNR